MALGRCKKPLKVSGIGWFVRGTDGKARDLCQVLRELSHEMRQRMRTVHCGESREGRSPQIKRLGWFSFRYFQ